VRRRLLPRALVAALLGCGVLTAPVVATAAAPTPSPSGASPTAPNPHPPLGGHAPDGSVPGGAALESRGIVLPTSSAQKIPKLPANLTAKAWVLADLDSGQILAARDPHGRYQPASVLKTLTAITIQANLPGSQVVTVSPSAAAAEGSALGLLAGGKYTVDELFQALFLVSANDAAAALAEANGGIAKTVAEMNAQAQRLGAFDTLVQTPSGLDGWQQLTSAYDLSLVLRQVVNTPRLLAYDELPSATLPPKKSSYGHVGVYQFDNQSNDFLTSVPGALLAKTGYTDAAQHTYVAAASRKGRRLGVVFLRAQRTPIDQWQQAAALLNWGYALPAGTPAVGTLIAASSPAPAAAPITATTPAATPSQNDAAPLLSTAPTRQAEAGSGPVAQAASVKPHAAGNRDQIELGLIALCVLLAGVASVRLRRLRKRLLPRTNPPPTATVRPREPSRRP
jgi:serine-type D-Ala-D-Ala carboxypeptidase (penicillin-binding protein 5/6)